MPDQNTNTDLWGQFAEETHCHGFKEAAAAEKPVPWKLYWYALLLTGFAFTVGSIVNTIALHFEEHTAITTTRFRPRQLANILICPSIWMSETNMRRVGISETDALSVDAVTMGTYLGANLSRTQFHHTVSKPIFQNQTLASIMNQISFDPDTLIQWRRNEDGEDIDQGRYFIKKVVGIGGVCYMVVENQRHNVYELQRERRAITLIDHEPPFNFGDYGGSMGGYEVGFSTKPEDPSFNQLLPVVKNSAFAVKYSIQRFIRTSTSRAPCRSWTEYENGICIESNINKICRSHGQTEIFTGQGSQQYLQQLSRWTDMATHCFRVLDELSDQNETDMDAQIRGPCPEPCDLDIYLPTFIPLGLGGQGVTFLEFSFMDVRNSWEFRQHLTSSTTELLNKIGGGLSLWFGASVLSIFHLVGFLLRAVVKVCGPNGARAVSGDIKDEDDTKKNSSRTGALKNRNRVFIS